LAADENTLSTDRGMLPRVGERQITKSGFVAARAQRNRGSRTGKAPVTGNTSLPRLEQELRGLVHEEGEPHMTVYQERIAPPLVPLADEEQMKLIKELIADEDRWVKNFVDLLAGVVREITH
jgi:hypothetical protein